MPGMRCLAELRCDSCGRRYYSDMPVGHGILYPMILDRETGEVFDRLGVPWFADWLRASYAHRHDEPIGVEIEQVRPLRDPVLLNCLDGLYGHAVLKLLNAQYYVDQVPAVDLVVLVPRWLRWMVPDRVAEIWTVDIGLRDANGWYESIASQLRERFSGLARCRISVAYPHPRPADYAIERFTGVTPFPLDSWASTRTRPIVSVVWRDDRVWGANRRHQQSRIAHLAEALRRQLPSLDVAVVGLGERGGLPQFVTDLRLRELSDETERSWCERYAASHVVVGVHGSGMLLPSAHAGGVVELLPWDRNGNLGQDLLQRGGNPRDAFVRYRVIPDSSSPQHVAEVTRALVDGYPELALSTLDTFADHAAANEVVAYPNRWQLQRSRQPAVHDASLASGARSDD